MNDNFAVKRYVSLAAWLGLCFVAAGIGAIASIDAKSFYAQLHQPDWAPPGWLFGPVWTVLYAMMGYAAWQIWCVGGEQARRALIIFVVQLVVNAIWSWLFFKFHLGLISFIEILLLWTLILATIVEFWRTRRAAGALLIPYALWVTFAAGLNWAMWQLNPGSLG